MGLPPLMGPAIGLSSSAEVATMKGTELVGEGGKSKADLPAASLPGARSAGKDPTVVIIVRYVL
jgi:hypothetical protein